MVGSIPDLDAQHVAVIDTNGITYNSVLNGGAELDDKLRDQDAYMKQKVSSQLDKLVGQGNYVVTVSTLLREATKETLFESYDPDKTAISSKQVFSENLNAKSANKSSTIGGPASSSISKFSATSSGGGSSNNKGYNRTGSEVTYRNTKTQWIETSGAGMVEDISVAVTIDKNHYPKSIGEMELKRLIAHAASPKVNSDSVTIARADFKGHGASGDGTAIGGTSSANDFEVDNSLNWIPWAAGALIVCFLLVIVLTLKSNNAPAINPQMEATQRELEELKNIATQQQAELQATQEQTQLLLEQRQQQVLPQPQMSSITGSGASGLDSQVPQQHLTQPPQAPLQETLSELKEAVQDENLDDDDLELQIKNWIESS